MIEVLVNEPVGEFKNLRLVYRETKQNHSAKVEMSIPCASLEDGILEITEASSIFENNYLASIIEDHKRDYWSEDLIAKYLEFIKSES
jgi:hypothetical protein